jgi:hypothetical protein
MSKLTNEIYNYIRPIAKYSWLLIIIIIFLLISVYAYYSYVKPSLSKTPSSNIANTVHRSNNNLDIYFFHVDWCPHCITALPEWKKFSDNINGTVVNGYTIICHDIDCTNDSDPTIAQLIKNNNIQGYPTVNITFDDGTQINFDSSISSKSLATFVTTVTSNK